MTKMEREHYRKTKKMILLHFKATEDEMQDAARIASLTSDDKKEFSKNYVKELELIISQRDERTNSRTEAT